MGISSRLNEKGLRIPPGFSGGIQTIKKNTAEMLSKGISLIEKPQSVGERIEDEIDGKPYTLLSAGNMESPYIVIHIHGLVGNMENFIPQMFDDSFELLGHISPNRFNDIVVKQGITIEKDGQMDIITQYLDTIIQKYAKDKKIFLHGASLGGEIAYNYAAKYPDQIKGVILCGASGLHNESFLAGKENIFENIKNPEWIQNKVNEHFVDPTMAPDNLVQSLQDMLQNRAQLTALMALGRTSVKSDEEKNIKLLKILQQANIPVQLMRGEKDTITPPHIAVPKFQEAAQIDEKNIHIFHNAHHMPNMDASLDNYNRRLKAFINRTLMNHN